MQPLIQKVQKKAFYSREALQAGIEGSLVLCVQINRSGEVIQFLVEQAAGHPILDGAALYSIGAAQALRENLGAMPDDFEPQKTMVWIDVSVDYRIVDAPPAQRLAVRSCRAAPPHLFLV